MTTNGHDLTTRSLNQLRYIFEGRVVTFRWNNETFTGRCDEVLNEPAKVIRFDHWFQVDPPGTTPPDQHAAALSPRLSEMSEIEIHLGSATAGGYVISPR